MVRRWVGVPTKYPDTPEYQLQQLKKLESLSLAKLAEWVALQADKLSRPIAELHRRDAAHADAVLSRHIQLIRNRLDCNVPRILFNKLANKSIKALSKLYKGKSNRAIENYVVNRMVETLFTKNLSYLDIRYWPQPAESDTYKESLTLSSGASAYCNVFLSSIYLKPFMLTGVTHLKMGSDNEADCTRFLKELHSLKYLSFSSSECTINILQCITENCRLIEELEFYSCPNLNDGTIDMLTQLPNLRVVHLSGTAVTAMGIKTLLLSCKNIEHIFINEPDIIPRALELVMSSGDYAGEVFKLKNCIINEISPRQIQLISQMCEIDNLTVLYNNSAFDFTSLKDIRELKLNDHNFKQDVNKVLQGTIGRNLEHLDLFRVSGIDLDALLHISQVCPNLKTLTINRCDFTRITCAKHGESRSSYAFCSVCGIKAAIPPFRNLKRFKCVIFARNSPDKYAHMTLIAELLSFVFSNCFNIEFIKLYSNSWLSDDYMLKVLAKNPMKFLKKLEIGGGVNLTMSTIDRLVQNCMNFPKVKRKM